MYSKSHNSQTSGPGAEMLIAALYHQLLDYWNRRDAGDFAELFTKDGFVVGFDGSQMHGRVEIEAELRRIFANHVTATYVGKVRGVNLITPEVGMLHAVSGMVPPMKADINPNVNAIQTLVAVQQGDSWCIASFQNTPAQFHERPDLAEALSQELRRLL